jgi:probable HAF family extracellular repeat protein
MAAVVPVPRYTEVPLTPLLIARGINDKGIAVGQLTTYPAQRGGVRYPSGRVITLGVLPGDDWSDASAINNVGQVIGRSGNSTTGVVRTFVWDVEGGMRWLGTLAGHGDQAAAINDRGVVVGMSNLVAGAPYPFTAFIARPKGQLLNLGTLLGSPAYSGASDINDIGQVIGDSEFGPFLWSSEGGVSFLPFSLGTYATGINRSGVIVGSYYNATRGKRQGFRWSSLQGFIDLGPANGDYGAAAQIGNNGTVVGLWIIGGKTRAFAGKGDDIFEIGGDGSNALAVNNCGVASGYASGGNGSYAAMWIPRGIALTGIC